MQDENIQNATNAAGILGVSSKPTQGVTTQGRTFMGQASIDQSNVDRSVGPKKVFGKCEKYAVNLRTKKRLSLLQERRKAQISSL